MEFLLSEAEEKYKELCTAKTPLWHYASEGANFHAGTSETRVTLGDVKAAVLNTFKDVGLVKKPNNSATNEPWWKKKLPTWRKQKPSDGDPLSFSKNNKTWEWCETCGVFQDTHNTATHVSKKKKKGGANAAVSNTSTPAPTAPASNLRFTDPRNNNVTRTYAFPSGF